MLLSFYDFQHSKKRLVNWKQVESFCSEFGWEGHEGSKAILVYRGNLSIFETEEGFHLCIGNQSYSSADDLALLEQLLYDYYCGESIERVEELKILAPSVIDFEWGTEPQINLENTFFNLVERFGLIDLESDEWQQFAIKATTSEMVEKVLEKIA